MFEMWQFSFLLSFELDFMTRVSCCNANVQVCPRSNGKVWGSSKLEITQVAGEPTGIEVWDAGKANEWRCDSDSVDWAGTDPEILVMPWSKCCCACWHNRRPGRANGSLRCGSAGRRWCAVPAVRDRSAWRWNGRTTFLDECLCPLCHIWPFQKISQKKEEEKWKACNGSRWMELPVAFGRPMTSNQPVVLGPNGLWLTLDAADWLSTLAKKLLWQLIG